MHIYQLLSYVLSTSFSTHPKPLTWDKKPFQSWRVHVFWHYETFPLFSALWDWFFSEIFLLFLPSIFDILQQNGCSKNSKAYPLLHFSALCDLPETSKKFREKNSEIFFSIFSFLRAFVVSSCRKMVFVFESFCSRLVDVTAIIHISFENVFPNVQIGHTKWLRAGFQPPFSALQAKVVAKRLSRALPNSFS